MKCFRVHKQDIPTYRKIPALEENETELQNAIRDLCRNGQVNVEELSQYLFPQRESPYNIFISHSHADFAVARSLAIFLKKCYGANAHPFVDGLVWHDVYNALLEMQTRYIPPILEEPATYPLEDCNRMASNLYLILTDALFKVLSKCTYFLFIQPDHWEKDANGRWTTDSPWIAQELSFARNMCENAVYIQTNESLEKSSSITFRYPVNIDWLPTIKLKSL